MTNRVVEYFAKIEAKAIRDEDAEVKAKNVLILEKGLDEKKQRYVFIFFDDRKEELLQMMRMFVRDPRLNFSAYDAAVLSRRVRNMAKEL